MTKSRTRLARWIQALSERHRFQKQKTSMNPPRDSLKLLSKISCDIGTNPSNFLSFLGGLIILKVIIKLTAFLSLKQIRNENQGSIPYSCLCFVFHQFWVLACIDPEMFSEWSSWIRLSKEKFQNLYPHWSKVLWGRTQNIRHMAPGPEEFQSLKNIYIHIISPSIPDFIRCNYSLSYLNSSLVSQRGMNKAWALTHPADCEHCSAWIVSFLPSSFSSGLHAKGSTCVQIKGDVEPSSRNSTLSLPPQFLPLSPESVSEWYS